MINDDLEDFDAFTREELELYIGFLTRNIEDAQAWLRRGFSVASMAHRLAVYDRRLEYCNRLLSAKL